MVALTTFKTEAIRKVITKKISKKTSGFDDIWIHGDITQVLKKKNPKILHFKEK